MSEHDYLAQAVTDYWGKRCRDFDAHCTCCKAWKQYDELARLRRVEAWRPIETAPKNTNIWLSNGSSMRVGYWRDGERYENHGSVGGGWRDFSKAENGGPGDLHFVPTCWYPVPKLPAARLSEIPKGIGDE